MINTIPSVADLNAATQLLSVLELAKDATALKAAIADLADAQSQFADQASKLAEERKAYEQSKANAERAADIALDAQRKSKEDQLKVSAAYGELADARDKQRAERNSFDQWMAEQRAAVNHKLADIESREDQIKRREAALAKQADELAAQIVKAREAEAAANAKGAELAAKLDSLKQFVNG